MQNLSVNDPTWLRLQASHCRVLAHAATSEDVEQRLLVIAEEYEADAANLDHEAVAHATAA